MRRKRTCDEIFAETSSASYKELRDRFVSDVLSGKYDEEREALTKFIPPKDPYLTCEDYIDQNGRRVPGLCSHALNRGILVYEDGILSGPGPHPEIVNR